MVRYPNAEALLADAKLRLDRFGPEYGVIVVEGPNDKRFLCSRTVNRQQVLAAGGRRILLAAHSIAKEEGIVFLTDCDYEVTLKTLTPSWDLIVTEHADVEADLLDNGGFEELVVQLVPSALDDDDEARRIALAVRERAVALADILGRIRQVAKAEAFAVDTEIRHRKYRKVGAAEVDERKLIRAVVQASREATLTAVEMEERTDRILHCYNNCNGHDLVAAVHHVLRDDYGVRDQTVDSIEKLLRNLVSSQRFADLAFVARLRRWEQQAGRRLLA